MKRWLIWRGRRGYDTRPLAKTRMNLPAPSKASQFLFAVVGMLLLVRGSIEAQQSAAASYLKLRGGQPVPGVILGVSGNGVQFQTQAGTITYPLANVESVQMNPPPEVAAARQAFESKDYPKALTSARAVANKYKGLPVEWAQSMLALTGDLYVMTDDIPKAEAVYAEFEKLYPGGGGLQAKVGQARVAAARKEFGAAKEKLTPIIDQALKEKNVPFANRNAYSSAFYVMGMVRESEKDYAGALEDYLRTVTVFYHDPTAVAAAQERADALRKEHKVTVP